MVIDRSRMAQVILLAGVSGAALLIASPAAAQVACYDASSLDSQVAQANYGGTACGQDAKATGYNNISVALGDGADARGNRAKYLAAGLATDICALRLGMLHQPSEPAQS